MNTPEWLKPGLIGAVAGGVAVAVAGFSWAGWTTAAAADRMGQAMADQHVIAALVPVCLERAENDPEQAAKLATIRQPAMVVRRRDALLEAGWATIEGNAAASRTLATACLAALEQRNTALPPPSDGAG
ncbi:MAG: hypothetical protein JJU42_12830 [Rhodobacteraceae bacterium]|nr:hypothetical protein [Paracoccaceae bacterium]